MQTSQLKDIRNYRSVDERLGTGGQPTEAQLQTVAQSGFEVVINLALHDDPRYSLPDETALVRSLGMRYVHIPVRFGEPTEADLQAFFATMDEVSVKRVFVHCAANYRVSAFLGLYRVLRNGEPVDRAFAQLLELWQPDAVWARFIAERLAQGGIRSTQFPTAAAG